VIVASSDLFDFYVLLSESFNFFWVEVGLKVIVAQRAYFLRVHPIEEAFLATVSPSPYATVLCQSYSMVFTKLHVFDLDTFSDQTLNKFRLRKFD
jgi:hypothetical protein